ncbi:MAG: hypothetical protein K0Q95_1385 [Bacteroidota bacterium]|jgi:hypothetical protein|nr:hypothetical protein [Bacteroidota bacterium]
MKKFILRSLLLSIPILLIILIFILVISPSEEFKKSLLYSHLDKKELLINTPAPRIIFVGGSNLSFGLNSQIISDSLKLNPVNTAIHISLGLKFMLANIQRDMHENDIVIISPEYEHFFGDFANGRLELLSLIADVDRSSVALLDGKQYFSLCAYLPKYMQSKLEGIFIKSGNKSGNAIYERNSFNKYGDACAHWTLPKVKVWPNEKITTGFNDDVMASLRKIREIAKAKHAKLFISFPCIQKKTYLNLHEQIEEVEQNLREDGFILLSSPERYVFPDSLLFNSPYHLTKQGVDIRTVLLIEDLKKALN